LRKKRKSGVKRANKAAKAAPELVKPGGKILIGKTMSEFAASRGVSEATLVTDILSSFDAHGGSAENKLGKEFWAWVRRFALTLHKDKARSQAWNELKSKCDVLMLLKELYFFTYIGIPEINSLHRRQFLPRYAASKRITRGYHRLYVTLVCD
jgi:hypothetical protein